MTVSFFVRDALGSLTLAFLTSRLRPLGRRPLLDSTPVCFLFGFVSSGLRSQIPDLSAILAPDFRLPFPHPPE